MGDGVSRRIRRLEEEELEREAKRRAAERDLREGLKRLTAEELEAMGEYFDGREDKEEWTEEDTPPMLRLLELKEEARRERKLGDFPWRAEMRGGGA